MADKHFLGCYFFAVNGELIKIQPCWHIPRIHTQLSVIFIQCKLFHFRTQHIVKNKLCVTKTGRDTEIQFSIFACWVGVDVGNGNLVTYVQKLFCLQLCFQCGRAFVDTFFYDLRSEYIGAFGRYGRSKEKRPVKTVQRFWILQRQWFITKPIGIAVNFRFSEDADFFLLTILSRLPFETDFVRLAPARPTRLI
jgi:hypothetical protein